MKQYMTEAEAMGKAMESILIPFLPRTKQPVNESDYDLLRDLKVAMSNVASKADKLAKSYPYEFRTTMSHIHSMSGAELQEFEQTQKENE